MRLYNGLHNGYIKYFDNLTGQGVITSNTPNMISFFVHFSASKNFNKKSGDYLNNKEKFISYTPVLFSLHRDSHYTQVDYFEIDASRTIDDVKSDLIIRILNNNESNLDLYLHNIIGDL